MVLAGIECSPKIFDFRASGIPDQERVDFFDTLKHLRLQVLFSCVLYVKILLCINSADYAIDKSQRQKFF